MLTLLTMSHSIRIGRRFVLVLPVLAMAALAEPGARCDDSPQAEAGPRIWAIEMETDNLAGSVGFYMEALGYSVERRDASGETVELRNGDGSLLLGVTDAPPAPAGTARVYLNMSVGDLEAATRRAVAMVGRIIDREPRTSPVGAFVEIRDPFGHPVHLIDHPWDEMASWDSQAVFNYGVDVRSIDEDEPFMTGLGLEVRTRKYLPETLVFKRQGIGYIVMHPDADRPCEPGWSAGALILAGHTTGDGGAATTLRGPSGVVVKMMRAD